MNARSLGLAVCLGLGCASAPEPRPRTPVERPIARSTAPIPHPARWIGLPAFRTGDPPLTLDNGERLHTGYFGRRLLLRADGFGEAGHLAPETLVASRRVGSGFRFFGALGGIYETGQPLAPFAVMRPSVLPLDARPEIAAGVRNAFAVAVDGRLFRSSDGGAFAPLAREAVAIPGWAIPRHVVMDASGRGFLLATPQRLFRTDDDGATWKPAHPPDGGVARLGVSDRGEFVARSITRPAEIVSLDGSSVVHHRELVDVELGVDPTARAALFLDDRFVRYDDRSLEITHADGKRVITAFPTRIDAIGGAGDEIVALGDRGLVRSSDGGARFDEPVPWPGAETGDRPRIVVNGHALAVAACSSRCSHVYVRAAPLEKFHEVAPVDGAEIVDVALVDGRVILLALEKDRVRLYAGAVSATKLERFGALDEPLPYATARHLSVDASGAVRAWMSLERSSILLRVDASGAPRPPISVPYSFAAVSMTGARGLAFVDGDADQFLLESADGGERWTRVGGPGASSIQCGGLGCLVGDVARMGWDLPAPPDAPRLPSLPVPTAAVRTISCAAKGPPRALAPLTRVFPHFQPTSLRLMLVEPGPDQSYALRVAGDVKAQPLISKVKLGKKLWTSFEVDGDDSGRAVVTKVGAIAGGILAMRSRFAVDRHPDVLAPVDVEVAWWSESSGKLHHAKLGTLPPFRVAIRSENPDAEAAVLGGDVLLLHPELERAAWLVRPDGTSKLLPFPADTALLGAAQQGSLLRFHGRTSRGDVFGVVQDSGLLRRFGWSFGEERPQLVAFGGLPYAVTAAAMFSLEELSSSVPDPVLRSAARPGCVSASGGALVVEETSGTTLAVEGSKPLKSVAAHVVVDAKGSGCVAGRSFGRASGDRAWVAGGTGWIVGAQLRAIVCAE